EDHPVGGLPVQVQPGVTARIRYEYLGAGWGYQVSVVAPARPLTVPVDLVGTDPVEQRVRRDDSRQKVLFALRFPPTAWEPVRPRLAEDDQYAASIEKATDLVSARAERVTVNGPQDEQQAIGLELVARQVVYV